jgi:aryl-alcohol dehydrogenase-like predicted oxidoreductase
MKLALGTVQFGLNYGVSNAQGQVSVEKIDRILQLASRHNIDTLDCAYAYGNSEQNIGNNSHSQSFNLVTKIPALRANEDKITTYFDTSLQRLKRDSVECLLLHDANNIIDHPAKAYICEQLLKLKSLGLVKKIGVSVYTPEQVIQAAEALPIDVVQAPMNLLDQRFCQSEVSHFFSQHHIELHTRSAFLQGLLLMDSNMRPAYFSQFNSLLNQVDDLAQQYKTSKLTIALAFLVQNSLVESNLEKIVVGCCSAEQLQQIVDSYYNALDLNISELDWTVFSSTEQALINPSLWKTD